MVPFVLITFSQSAWYFGNCIAALLGGVISYAIGHINTASIAHWKLIFLILGAVTSGYAMVLFLLLPDSPAKAVFLSQKERAIAVQRTLENKTGVLDFGSFKWNQALEATLDPQTWFLVLYTFTSNLANGGLTTVRSACSRLTTLTLTTFSLRRLLRQGLALITSKLFCSRCP